MNSSVTEAREALEGCSLCESYILSLSHSQWCADHTPMSIVVYEISRLLQTDLDRETLTVLVSLCEAGVNPEALAAVVKELRRESANISQ